MPLAQPSAPSPPSLPCLLPSAVPLPVELDTTEASGRGVSSSGSLNNGFFDSPNPVSRINSDASCIGLSPGQAAAAHLCTSLTIDLDPEMDCTDLWLQSKGSLAGNVMLKRSSKKLRASKIPRGLAKSHTVPLPNVPENPDASGEDTSLSWPQQAGSPHKALLKRVKTFTTTMSSVASSVASGSSLNSLERPNREPPESTHPQPTASDAHCRGVLGSLLLDDLEEEVRDSTDDPKNKLLLANCEPAGEEHSYAFAAFFDALTGVVILLNGIFIGISTDLNEDKYKQAWLGVETAFMFFFLFEALYKLNQSGCKQHFCGPDWGWNCFDAIIVLLAIIDLIIIISQVDMGASASQVSVVRLARLTRLTRLVRVFQISFFKELTQMVRGFVQGLRTLFWAIVLLFFAIYILGILLTQVIGQGDPVTVAGAESFESQREDLFGNIFRSCFTVFRCLIGDCSDYVGQPLSAHLFHSYSELFVVFYYIVIMSMTFGLFNLIMAIFIDNVMRESKFSDRGQKAHRDRENIMIQNRTRHLLLMFYTSQQGNERTASKLSLEQIEEFLIHGGSMEVTKEQFDAVMDHPQAQEILDDLDVRDGDRRGFFELLDANGDGTLEISEIVQGLLALRGEARKSDVVATLLKVKSCQESLQHVVANQKKELNILKALGRAVGSELKGLMTMTPGGFGVSTTVAPLTRAEPTSSLDADVGGVAPAGRLSEDSAQSLRCRLSEDDRGGARLIGKESLCCRLSEDDKGADDLQLRPQYCDEFTGVLEEHTVDGAGSH